MIIILRWIQNVYKARDKILFSAPSDHIEFGLVKAFFASS